MVVRPTLYAFGLGLLFIGGVCCILTICSSPVIASLAFLRLSLNNGIKVTWGALGYCVFE
jgi:hypothetical protein